MSAACMQDTLGANGLEQRETWRRKGESGRAGPVLGAVVGR